MNTLNNCFRTLKKLCVWFILMPIMVQAADLPPGGIQFKSKEEIDIGIARQLEYLLARNKDTAGTTPWYIYMVGEDHFDPALLDEYSVNMLDLEGFDKNTIPPLSIEELNARLVNVNKKLKEAEKPLIYYGVTNKKTAIPVPYFPFKKKYAKKSAPKEEFKEFYNVSLSDNSDNSETGQAREVYQTLTRFFAEEGEYEKGQTNLITAVLKAAGDQGAIAISKYYWAFILNGTHGGESAKIKWYGISTYRTSGDTKVEDDKYQAYYRSLAANTKNTNLRRINAWYNYLSGAELPQSAFLESMLAGLYSNPHCRDLSLEEGNTQEEDLRAAIDTNDPDEIEKQLTITCEDVVKQLEYKYLIKAIKTLAGVRLENDKEAMVLYLMHAIDSRDYGKWFADLKQDENWLMIRLMAEMDDHSLNPIDGEHYTSFIGELLYMGYQNQGEYMIKERSYLVNTILQARFVYHWEANPVIRGLSSIMSFNLDKDEINFENYLTRDSYAKLFEILQFLGQERITADVDSPYIELGDALAKFFTLRQNEQVYKDLTEKVLVKENFPSSFSAEQRVFTARFVYRLFGDVPTENDSSEIFRYLSENKFEHLKTIVTQTSEHNYHTYAYVFYNGITKLLDKYGSIDDRIALAQWVIDDDSFLNNTHENFVASLFRNIEDRADQKKIYNFLTYGNTAGVGDKTYDYYYKISNGGVLEGSDDLHESFINFYVSLILDFGDVNDRIAIIRNAVDNGEQYVFWVSDGETVLSTLFNNLNSTEAIAMVEALSDNKYKLFKDIWEILEDDTWWADIDRDNARFANFANQVAKTLKLSNNELQILTGDYEGFLDQHHDYLNNNPANLPVITANYLPMCRANFFGYTSGHNNYDLTAELKEVGEDSAFIHLNLDIEGANLVERNYAPFDYIYVEFVEDTEINSGVKFKKGQLIGVPAFYVAWMNGAVTADQNSVAMRVSADALVILASTAVIAGSGGTLTPAVMAASAEIFFAGTDIAVATYGDEMAGVMGEDFVRDLEMANMIYGLANLPVALKDLPRSLVRIKTMLSNGKWIEFARNVSLAGGDKVTRIEVNMQGFISNLPSIISQLRKANRQDVINNIIKTLHAQQELLAYKLPRTGGALKVAYDQSVKAVTEFYRSTTPLVGKLIDKFPQRLQVRISERLLQLHLDGKQILKLSPEGILQEVKLIARADTYKPIEGMGEAFKVKLAHQGKIYDQLVVVREYNGKLVFRPKFVENQELPAGLINELYIRAEKSPAYMPGTQVTDHTIEVGKKFYVVEYEYQLAPGAFGTSEPIRNLEQLREKLAVLNSWKDPQEGVIVVREYEALQPIKTRSGTIGPQKETSGINAGNTYQGGGHQYEFLDNWSSKQHGDYMRKVSSTRLAGTGSSWTELVNKITIDWTDDLKAAFKLDFPETNPSSLEALDEFAKNPKLVDAWRILFQDGDAVSDALRKDINTLEWFSKNADDIADNVADDLLRNLDGKTVERTFEDAQGRLVVMAESSNSTRTVATLEKMATGEVKSFKYTNAYNKAGQPGKQPVSANGLTPDFSGNPEWLYPVTGNQKNIVKIKLSGKRKGTDGDFHRANQEAGFPTTKAPEGYTWHHMDDFDPVTGESTMQLVKTTDHMGSLPHTGSVKQFENYSGTTYTD